MDTGPERADSVPMSNETRGKALYERMVAMGMDESKLARAVNKDRGTIRRVFAGTASDITYDQVEVWFAREEAKDNSEIPAAPTPAARKPVTIRMEEGGTIVVEGPLDTPEDAHLLRDLARDLMREMRTRRESGE